MTAACVFAACYSQHAHDTGAGSSMLSASCRPVLALPLATTVGHDCLSRLAENTCKYNKAGMTVYSLHPTTTPTAPFPSSSLSHHHHQHTQLHARRRSTASTITHSQSWAAEGSAASASYGNECQAAPVCVCETCLVFSLGVRAVLVSVCQ